MAVCLAGFQGAKNPDLNARLIDSCFLGDAGKVNRLIDAGANPNSFDKNPYRGFSALTSALDHPEVVTVLLKRGADPNLIDRNDLVPAQYAASVRSAKCLKLLLDAGADPNAKAKGGAPLSAAAGSGSIDCAKLLLDRGADIHYRSSNGVSALDEPLVSLFTELGQRKRMLQLLLDKGADINGRIPKSGNTPLHIAISYFANRPKDRLSLAQFLLDHGADPMAKNILGQTPLDLAQTDQVRRLGITPALEEMIRKAIESPPSATSPSLARG